MISRNKGIFSSDFLVPTLGIIVALVLVEPVFALVVRPRAEQIALKLRVMAAQGASRGDNSESRSIYVIIKDPEQETEIIFAVWGFIILGHKLLQVRAERRLFKHDFIRIQPGERIIPEDALDRYKDLRTAVEREPRWRDRLLPECMLSALHRFHATNSIQDAANAVKERAELTADRLDSSLSLVRYIAWAIPAVGFIGTVRGIGLALAFAEDAIKGDIAPVTDALGLAFNSTLVALLISMVLMYVMHIVQSRQEAFILETQTYCRDKLIDVMKVPVREENTGAYV
ncbi:MAG: MotA/TolQ/ExbB proton channel family protein [Opitutaceae bacterium]|nr:MotA/TolQ/ExbB proton channel family protein [Opitutaceae bacterium]